MKPRKASCSGFTLIEMLLAITIFSMIVVVIFSAFRLGIGSWQKGESNIAFFQKMRAVSELLFRELNSTFPYIITPGTLDTHKKFYAFFGTMDTLKFVSYANLHKRTGGLSLIELWVEEGKGLMLGEEAALVSNLSDLEDIDLRDEDRARVLCPEADRVSFRYFDRKKKEMDGEWVENWDPKNNFGGDLRLPLFVEISFTFLNEKEEQYNQRLIVPIMNIRL